MDKRQAAKGTVVQVRYNAGTLFDGCMVVVEKVSNWGFQGYTVVPRTTREANAGHYKIAPVRMAWNLVEPVGTVIWDVGNMSANVV